MTEWYELKKWNHIYLCYKIGSMLVKSDDMFLGDNCERTLKEQINREIQADLRISQQTKEKESSTK